MPTRSIWKSLKRHSRRGELALALLHGAGKVLHRVNSAFDAKASQVVDAEMQSAGEEYSRLPQQLIHKACDVETSSAQKILWQLQPDVTICLGGPIYPKPFLDCSPLTLNFHSGISPLYNGAASPYFAFANGHPHLCGGTLMTMGTGVDNGGILGHYLPAIDRDDSPDTLFIKTVKGGIEMYDRFLSSLAESQATFAQIPQPLPLFYTRGIELGLTHQVLIARNRKRKLAAQFSRPERKIEYWRIKENSSALQLYQQTISSLLWERAAPNQYGA